MLKGTKCLDANRRNALQKNHCYISGGTSAIQLTLHMPYCKPAVLSYHLTAGKSPFSEEMLLSVLMAAKHSTAIFFTKA